ncbi:hypothetical protein CMUS01_09013 [Colletotrichum musicola]|uniref:Uncharacterized protein n=1 Tax=Colletotrichum musicola TaxID=2175873 RepID=A0A8H6KAB4_9PEZI|nr:hypothetical protein CMUS01_09013 [Colletotrichum musicola]
MFSALGIRSPLVRIADAVIQWVRVFPGRWTSSAVPSPSPIVVFRSKKRRTTASHVGSAIRGKSEQPRFRTSNPPATPLSLALGSSSFLALLRVACWAPHSRVEMQVEAPTYAQRTYPASLAYLVQGGPESDRLGPDACVAPGI